MQVIATARGHDGLTIREVDDVFDMPDGAKGSWFQPVGEPPAAKPADAPPGAKRAGKAKTVSEASPEHEDGIA